MYRQLFSTSITTITIVASTLPVLANPLNKLESSPQTTNIEAIEAIVVTFPKEVKFDVGAKKQQPVVLRIGESVKNNAGKVVIPADSRVEAILVPVGKGKDKGTMIFAKSLIMNGKSYPLNATLSNKIPAHKETTKSRSQQAQAYSSSVSSLSTAYSAFTGGIEDKEINRNKLLIQGVGAIIGYLTPRSKLASNIAEGSEYILHLKEPLSLNTTQNIPVVADNSSPTK